MFFAKRCSTVCQTVQNAVEMATKTSSGHIGLLILFAMLNDVAIKQLKKRLILQCFAEYRMLVLVFVGATHSKEQHLRFW